LQQKCKNDKFKDEIKSSLKTNQTKSKAMFGFGPCTLKKKSKIANLLQLATNVFAMQVATTSNPKLAFK
jgi:hypothetical protein